MKKLTNLLITLILINLLSSCSSMSGNVVPQVGPTMEEVYDSMDANQESEKQVQIPHALNTHYATDTTFHKLPNPELKMYVFPHLATKDAVPIPGYTTVFNAYSNDHYI